MRNQHYSILFLHHLRQCRVLHEICASRVLRFRSRQLYLRLPRRLDDRRTPFLALFTCTHRSSASLLAVLWIDRHLAAETSCYSPSQTWHGVSLPPVSASTSQPRTALASASSLSSSTSSPHFIVREKVLFHLPTRLRSSHSRIVNLGCLGPSLHVCVVCLLVCVSLTDWVRSQGLFWASVLSVTFPRMLEALGSPGAFGFYAGLNMTAFVMIFFLVPGTLDLPPRLISASPSLFKIPTLLFSFLLTTSNKKQKRSSERWKSSTTSLRSRRLDTRLTNCTTRCRTLSSAGYSSIRMQSSNRFMTFLRLRVLVAFLRRWHIRSRSTAPCLFFLYCLFDAAAGGRERDGSWNRRVG